MIQVGYCPPGSNATKLLYITGCFDIVAVSKNEMCLPFGWMRIIAIAVFLTNFAILTVDDAL
jgi:hypothetical protein